LQTAAHEPPDYPSNSGPSPATVVGILAAALLPYFFTVAFIDQLLDLAKSCRVSKPQHSRRYTCLIFGMKIFRLPSVAATGMKDRKRDTEQ